MGSKSKRGDGLSGAEIGVKAFTKLKKQESGYDKGRVGGAL